MDWKTQHCKDVISPYGPIDLVQFQPKSQEAFLVCVKTDKHKTYREMQRDISS